MKTKLIKIMGLLLLAIGCFVFVSFVFRKDIKNLFKSKDEILSEKRNAEYKAKEEQEKKDKELAYSKMSDFEKWEESKAYAYRVQSSCTPKKNEKYSVNVIVEKVFSYYGNGMGGFYQRTNESVTLLSLKFTGTEEECSLKIIELAKEAELFAENRMIADWKADKIAQLPNK